MDNWIPNSTQSSALTSTGGLNIIGNRNKCPIFHLRLVDSIWFSPLMSTYGDIFYNFILFQEMSYNWTICQYHVPLFTVHVPMQGLI